MTKEKEAQKKTDDALRRALNMGPIRHQDDKKKPPPKKKGV